MRNYSKFHLSDQRPGARTGMAHADYVEEIPEILFETSKDTPLDIMIEAKHKENSVFWLMNKYPDFLFGIAIIYEHIYR